MKNTACDAYMGPRLQRHVQVRRMRAAISRELTPCQQRIVRGIYYEGKSQAQLARELGVHKSTVSRTLHRARVRLQKCLRY